jgi:hypothetical protein
MIERPSFVPADVPDEAVSWWLGTYDGQLARMRAEYAAAGLTGMVDQVDALRSDMHGRAESALGSQGCLRASGRAVIVAGAGVSMRAAASEKAV